jgi:orotidine-5'-phosphate decarboxylase
MKRTELVYQMRQKRSYLCVGLDTDIEKIPADFLKADDPVFEFNKSIIDATKDYAVAYKANIAFYESLGYKGWISLEKTVNYIPEDIFKIADAKRGDIGNTSRQYAKTFFETLNFDAITVSPYMGEDSVGPFLEYKNKWVIILALTSNKGSADFQLLNTGQDKKLYEDVLLKSSLWGSENNIMYVVGATHPDLLADIRMLIPNHFILIPGVGAQGGDLQKISINALNNDVGILVNVSRDIIFPEKKEDFPDNVRERARYYQQIMAGFFQ